VVGGRTFLGVQIFENMLLPVKQTLTEYYHVRGNLLLVCRAALLLFLDKFLVTTQRLHGFTMQKDIV
jgi:hypothetical protein